MPFLRQIFFRTRHFRRPPSLAWRCVASKDNRATGGRELHRTSRSLVYGYYLLQAITPFSELVIAYSPRISSRWSRPIAHVRQSATIISSIAVTCQTAQKPLDRSRVKVLGSPCDRSFFAALAGSELICCCRVYAKDHGDPFVARISID